MGNNEFIVTVRGNLRSNKAREDLEYLARQFSFEKCEDYLCFQYGWRVRFVGPDGEKLDRFKLFLKESYTCTVRPLQIVIDEGEYPYNFMDPEDHARIRERQHLDVVAKHEKHC